MPCSILNPDKGFRALPLALLLIFGQQITQPVEPSLPQRASCANPLLRHREPLRLHLACAHPANFRRVHQSALFEYLYVLNHRRQGDVERPRQTRNRNRALAHPFKNRPARGIAQRMKNPIYARCLGWRTPRRSRTAAADHASSFASFSRSSRHPSSRIAGPSAPSKNAPCSVKTSRVPAAVGSNSKVARDAENRHSPIVIV